MDKKDGFLIIFVYVGKHTNTKIQEEIKVRKAYLLLFIGKVNLAFFVERVQISYFLLTYLLL